VPRQRCHGPRLPRPVAGASPASRARAGSCMPPQGLLATLPAAHVPRAPPGPTQVAVGSLGGTVALLDASRPHLEPVARFAAAPGPVSLLAACAPPLQAQTVGATAAPRGWDGGGVLGEPAGLPWRAVDSSPSAQPGGHTYCSLGLPHAAQPHAAGRARHVAGRWAWRGRNRAPAPPAAGALLAAASPSGWLHVYAAQGPGEAGWRCSHRAAVPGVAGLSFGGEGGYLAVAAAGGESWSGAGLGAPAGHPPTHLGRPSRTAGHERCAVGPRTRRPRCKVSCRPFARRRRPAWRAARAGGEGHAGGPDRLRGRGHEGS
jgi:hypothetical protein